jgi:Zn-finger nucleic acid-binding protein
VNCPLCTDQMLMPRFRAGIEIDVCPNCHGMWLDRGELEKLVEPDERTGYARSMSGAEQWPPAREPEIEPFSPRYAIEARKAQKAKKKRKKSLAERLGDVLDDVLD